MRGGPRTAVLVAGLGLLSLVSLIGDALSPSLLRRGPLLLVCLTPRTPYLLVGAHRAPLVLVLAIAVPRLLVADPLHFVLGRRQHDRVSHRLPGSIHRVGVPLVAANPTGKVLALAGVAGLPAGAVATADVIGTVLRVVLVWLAANTVPGVGAIVAVPLLAPALGFGCAAAVGVHVLLTRRWPAGPRRESRAPYPRRRDHDRRERGTAHRVRRRLQRA